MNSIYYILRNLAYFSEMCSIACISRWRYKKFFYFQIYKLNMLVFYFFKVLYPQEFLRLSFLSIYPSIIGEGF